MVPIPQSISDHVSLQRRISCPCSPGSLRIKSGAPGPNLPDSTAHMGGSGFTHHFGLQFLGFVVWCKYTGW